MIILDIIITHADEGEAVVIIDVNDYIRHYHNACRERRSSSHYRCQ